MHVFETNADLIKWRQEQNESIAFVATMGALHEGHIKVIQTAASYAKKVVVSIFVNPLQFAPHEDFEQYPRTLEADLDALRKINVDCVFTPTRSEIYPNEHCMQVLPDDMAKKLCGISRPHFFGGVTTVVMKLFNLVQPDFAFFGEKDYQQLRIIQNMARDFFLKTKVIGVQTVREADGLAKSSRNRYLNPEQRSKAVLIFQTMQAVTQKAKTESTMALESWAKQQLEGAGFKIDYLCILREDDLGAPQAGDEKLRIFVATWLGQTRLIDNMAI